MVEGASETTRSHWPWAIAAALSVGCAAFVFYLRQRSASRIGPDDLEEWWRDQNPQLFV